MRKHVAAKFISVAVFSAISSFNPAIATDNNVCKDLPSHAELKAVLHQVVAAGGNAGFGFNMWVSTVNRDGVVCAVAFSGDERGDQFPGSRVISAQKANTANAFSLPNFALSTANLFSAVQPGQSLYGIQHSNPVHPHVAYGGNSTHYGTPNDFMTGRKIGGVNVFAGGLALYRKDHKLIGAMGTSGDSACTDHIIAWKMRHILNLDSVPAGPAGPGYDNLVHDISTDPATGHSTSAGGFGHPTCDANATLIANQLPTTHPIGAN